MGKPLEGLLAVCLEQAVAAPYCSMRLAEAGARVIKIERADGDFARAYDRVAKGQSSYFVWLNHSKQSIALDIKQPADQALLDRMVARADVFIQNLGPGAAARAGFDSAQLRARDPRLITCDISGYGEEGAYAGMKSYDLLVQAESGLAAVTGRPEGPGRVGVSVCDIGAGMHAYMAILEAVIGRQSSGQGKQIAVSLFDGMAHWMSVPLLHQTYGEGAPPRVGLSHPSIAPYGVYDCVDGQVVICIQNQREWRRFCEVVIDRAGLADDPRFHDNPARVVNRAALDREIEAIFGLLLRSDLIERLTEGSIAYGAVNSVADLAAHPQLRLATAETPGGPVELVAPPARAAGEPPRFGAVPSLDQHGGAIRQEFA